MARQFQDAYERESSRLGRAATDEDVAAYLGIGVETLQSQMGRLNTLIVHSVEDLIHRSDDDQARHELADPNEPEPIERLERAELLDALRHALGQLPDRERLILGLYYYERLTLAEIAGVLGLTESRISQMQSAALLRLRASLSALGFAGA